MHGLRAALGQLADERSEWAGIPMPLEGERLIVEPRYPKAKELNAIGAKPPDPEDEGVRVRNVWWSWRWRCEIWIYEKDGRLGVAKIPAVHSLSQQLSTIGCSDAWGIEQEQRALQLLGQMVRHRAFKQYLLTGAFLETSERSGLLYIFRRLRPTVAVSMSGPEPRILCTLCMHPIAYYHDSWAGAMCPTDDVIAHLALMRGDEAMFWRRCNQHPPHRPEAGI